MGLYKAALQNGREYGGNGSGVYVKAGREKKALRKEATPE